MIFHLADSTLCLSSINLTCASCLLKQDDWVPKPCARLSSHYAILPPPPAVRAESQATRTATAKTNRQTKKDAATCKQGTAGGEGPAVWWQVGGNLQVIYSPASMAY